jgi:hypothetical protein
MKARAPRPRHIKDINCGDFDRLYELRQLGAPIPWPPKWWEHVLHPGDGRTRIRRLMGHSDETWEQGLPAVKAGVTHATHLFNA